MPRGQLTKQEMKMILLEYKKKLGEENASYTSDPKAIASRYLNLLLDKIEEYAR
jgi:hypothetical protein